jgi:hypothetical protein
VIYQSTRNYSQQQMRKHVWPYVSILAVMK